MTDKKIYTVWVGGVEINDELLTLQEAQTLAFAFVRDDYDDVVIDTYNEQILKIYNMEEQLITFETAKLAKEKGFKEQTAQMYNSEGELVYWIDALYLAPTQSLLQKWIREVHNLHICVENVNVPIKDKWIYEIDKLPVGVLVLWNKDTSPNFDTFEGALEAGLQQALKLIKL